MGVAQSVSLFVADGFEELVYPDGSIYRKAFAVKGRERRWASARVEDRPEAMDTHDEKEESPDVAVLSSMSSR